jgi:hypothetical protein
MYFLIESAQKIRKNPIKSEDLVEGLYRKKVFANTPTKN